MIEEIMTEKQKEQQLLEHLVKCAEKVARKEEEYVREKNNLESLKADYLLLNNWEELLGKKKPTQKEKDAFISKSVEQKKNEVDQLKICVDYCKRIYDIQMKCRC